MKRIACLALLVLAHAGPAEARGWKWFVENTRPGPHCPGTPHPTTYYERHGYGVATWDHPFGTKLLVTNCNNGKSVVVTVRDRGPRKDLYRMGIKYDLYYTAAREISLGQNGRFESGWTSVTVIGSEATAR